MVQEATILQKGRIVRVGRHTTLRISEDETANEIAGNLLLDHLPKRFPDQGIPGLLPLAMQASPHFLPGNKRLGQARPNEGSHSLLHGLQCHVSTEVGLVPGQGNKGFAIRIRGIVAKEQFLGFVTLEIRGVRCNPA